MDVTLANFEESLKTFEEAVAKSDFVAFDLEFSGLSTRPQSFAQREMDKLQMAHNRHQINYAKHRHSVSQLLIMQFGCCPFEWNEARQSYIARPFNFNIFPDESIDKIFNCSVSTFRFLWKNKFDFNKMVGEGVPYLSHHDAEVLRNRAAQSKLIDTTAIEDKNFIHEQLDSVLDWMSDLPVYGSTLDITFSNKFQALVFSQEIIDRFTQLVAQIAESDYENRRHVVRVTSLDPSQRQAFLNQLIEQAVQAQEDKLAVSIGFRKCIDVLSRSRLLVGHNMFLDMLHTYDKFFRPLPQELDQFKSEWKNVFPRVIDTKHVAHLNKSQTELQFTTLPATHAHFCQPPRASISIEFPPGFERYTSDEFHHEAGFDAYLTGMILANMAAFITNRRGQRIDNESLQPFVNRAYLMGMTEPLNLDGSEVPESIPPTAAGLPLQQRLVFPPKPEAPAAVFTQQRRSFSTVRSVSSLTSVVRSSMALVKKLR
eukprot:c9430_g1_i1.p1 GENE.c9430_g1_i1~~c9430_g1_i1.p1  ORF type:complete len:484 (-),score=110.53 c9430_g1_i1:32-1483(-)